MLSSSHPKRFSGVLLADRPLKPVGVNELIMTGFLISTLFLPQII